MPDQLRTKDELNRAQWAEKFMSVTEGNQYVADIRGSYEDSPFPVHSYFNNRLLGRKIKMLEVNAGSALIEHMVADMVTDMKIQVNDSEDDSIEQEILVWMQSIDYQTTLEEVMRDYCGTGYGVQQPIRTPEGDITISTVDPSTWYPVLPTFSYQKVTEGRIISVFPQVDPLNQQVITQWYAFVETHTVGEVTYQLYALDNAKALQGKLVPLSTLARFADLPDSAPTELDGIAVFQRDRQKSSRRFFGKSVLAPIWDILQEISEIQTQIRHERIKHFKAKLAVPRESLQKVERRDDLAGLPHPNSKELRDLNRGNEALYDANQEIFPIPAGATHLPQYIIRDLQTIEKGSAEIDKLLSRAAAVVGAPQSIFNLDEKGTIHVDTEKRKDRRYVKQIEQGQRQASGFAQDAIKAWWTWQNPGTPMPDITVTFSSAFEVTQEETVGLMREMNPDGVFVSDEEAIKQIWRDMKPEDRQNMMDQIKAEASAQALPPNNAALAGIPALKL